MKYCKKCGHACSSKALVCPACGAPLDEEKTTPVNLLLSARKNPEPENTGSDSDISFEQALTSVPMAARYIQQCQRKNESFGLEDVRKLRHVFLDAGIEPDMAHLSDYINMPATSGTGSTDAQTKPMQENQNYLPTRPAPLPFSNESVSHAAASASSETYEGHTGFVYAEGMPAYFHIFRKTDSRGELLVLKAIDNFTFYEQRRNIDKYPWADLKAGDYMWAVFSDRNKAGRVAKLTIMQDTYPAWRQYKALSESLHVNMKIPAPVYAYDPETGRLTASFAPAVHAIGMPDRRSGTGRYQKGRILYWRITDIKTENGTDWKNRTKYFVTPLLFSEKTVQLPDISNSLLISADRIRDLQDMVPETAGTMTGIAIKNEIIRLYNQRKETRQVLCWSNKKDSPAEMTFNTGWRDKNGCPVCIILVKDNRNNEPVWKCKSVGLGKNWVSSYFSLLVDTDNINTVIRSLADMAVNERWDFKGTHDLPVLKSYLSFTFYKSMLDGNYTENREGDLVFDTGLVNGSYESIYCRLDRNGTSGEKMYIFRYFAVRGVRSDGKSLNEDFTEFPKPPVYITDATIANTYLNTEKTISTDYEHVLLDNIDRLPMEFITHELSYSSEINRIAEAVSKNPADKDACMSELAEIIQNDDEMLRRLSQALQQSISEAVKRCRWNYKTAVPIYYARANEISVLLPLRLVPGRSDEGSLSADAALVVSRLENGNYQGETILTLDMAYKDARQICKPDSAWLSADYLQPEKIDAVHSDDESDEAGSDATEPSAENSTESDNASDTSETKKESAASD